MINEFKNLEITRPEVKSGERKINTIDAELKSLEAELSFSDRMGLLRDLFEEIDFPKANSARQKEIEAMHEHQEAKENGNLKHYFLPGIPGGNGDTQQIREAYDRRAQYAKTDKHIFVKIGQGEMWLIPKEKSPYLKVSMSECSTIIAHDSENLLVAHISYTDVKEIEAVMDFLKKHEMTADKIFAITGVKRPDVNRDKVEGNGPYIQNGVLPTNIKNFDYQAGELDSNNTKISRDLTQVLISQDGFLKWSSDLKQTFKQNSYQEELIGGFKNEEILQF